MSETPDYAKIIREDTETLARMQQRRAVDGAKPLCLDCYRAGIINCSHFDTCEGRWVYVPTPTSQPSEPRAHFSQVVTVEQPSEGLRERCAKWFDATPDNLTREQAIDLIARFISAELSPLRERLRNTLTEHWLFAIECHHEAKTDQAMCACGLKFPERENVGTAVGDWIEHVVVALDRMGK